MTVVLLIYSCRSGLMQYLKTTESLYLLKKRKDPVPLCLFTIWPTVCISRFSAATGKRRSPCGTSSGRRWSPDTSESTLSPGSTLATSAWGWRSLAVLCQVKGLYGQSRHMNPPNEWMKNESGACSWMRQHAETQKSIGARVSLCTLALWWASDCPGWPPPLAQGHLG